MVHDSLSVVVRSIRNMKVGNSEQQRGISQYNKGDQSPDKYVQKPNAKALLCLFHDHLMNRCVQRSPETVR